jgi:hypothetical protein
MMKCLLSALALSCVVGFGTAFGASFGALGPMSEWQVLIPGGVCAVVTFVTVLIACRRGALSAEDFPQMFRDLWNVIGRW